MLHDKSNSGGPQGTFRALLAKKDPELLGLLCQETDRQRDTLDMIASESLQDCLTLGLMGSDFGGKTAVGLPGNQRLLGSEAIDGLEKLAARRTCSLFGAEHANLLPYSGTTANLCAYAALLSPGDTVLALDPEHGSHASHGRQAHLSAQIYRFVHFGVDPETQCLDYDRLEATAMSCKPRLLLMGASSYPRLFDYPWLARIAHSVGAWLMVDMAHTTGLTAAGVIPSPVPWADVVTGSCTKTMCGCHTGFILCRESLRQRIDRAVYPGLLGSLHPQTIAAAAWAMKRASEPDFRALMGRVLENTAALAQALKARGLAVLTGKTECHMFVLDLRGHGTDGVAVSNMLADLGIWTNTKGIPYDTSPVPRGIRMGCTVLTQRGMGKAEMEAIADILRDCVRMAEQGPEEGVLARCRERVRSLCRAFPV